MYRDLYTRIILNNALKVTLDIVENFFFSNEQLCIVDSETFHILLENRAWRILSRPPGIDARNSVMMTPTHRFFSPAKPAKEVLT